MFSSGEIVVQDRTMINNVNYKDNKTTRLSVVLFETKIDGDVFVCTAPLTNNPKAALKYQDSYYYIPYLIYDERKYSCVKLNAANIYNHDLVHSTGIYLGKGHMNRIFSKLMDYPEPKNREELYKLIRENISSVKEKTRVLDAEEKRKQKQMRLEKRRNAKRGVNLV